MTENFPQFQLLYRPDYEGMVLDGGLVAGVNPSRKRNLWIGGDLLLCMQFVGSGPDRSAELQHKKGRAIFIAWDFISYPKLFPVPSMGWNPLKAPIEVRRKNLVHVARSLGVHVVPQWKDNLKWRYERVVSTGGEGLMLKRKKSIYEYKRSMAWQKVKRYEDVIGLVHSKKADGKGAWKGLIGSINVSDGEGNIIGGVGTMTLERRKELSMPDGSLNPAFIGRKVLIRYYAKHSETGNPRHCRLIGWIGEDIEPEEIIKEEVEQ
jgi:hypothetical protein